MLDTAGPGVSATATSPEGVDYPALRDQANGLGPKTPPLFGSKP
jgi:hypothetical protein